MKTSAVGRFLVCFLLFPPVLLAAGQMHPVETRLRVTFPALPLDSSASFAPSEVVVKGQNVSGLRAEFPRAGTTAASLPAPSPHLIAPQAEGQQLRVQYPPTYDAALVVDFGSERVVLRAVGAKAAPATHSGGKLIYEWPWAYTDSIQVPGEGRSEEMLLLHDPRAPRIFEYQIVETQGIAAVVLDGGAIRFLPERANVPSMSDIAAGRFSQPASSLQIDRPWVIDSLGNRSDTAARWSLGGTDPIPAVLRLTLSDDHLSYPLVVDPSFSATGNLATTREFHTATLLPNGKVLIAGGTRSSGALATAELYDPIAGTFSATGSLATARYAHTATLLPNGKVLIAGGIDVSYSSVATAELYDPAAGTFSATESLATARRGHTATLLPNGKVLITGGSGSSGYLLTTELYDPAAGTFSATGSLASGRDNHTATLLSNGKVLIAGGYASGYLATAALYDPAAGTFSATGSLATARYDHTATLLSNGKVLIAAGYSGVILATAELYDPAAGTFSATGSLATARRSHTATLLPNGKVLLAGGWGSSDPSLAAAELYDPTAGTFSAAGNLATARYDHTATLLSNGKVLIAAGYNGVILATAELYDPTAGTFSATGSLATARRGHTATLLPNGKVLLTGGWGSSDPSLAAAELYDPAAGTCSAAGNLVTGRRFHTATLLPNGKVLLAGGANASLGTLATAELYDPATGTFSATGNLATALYNHTATLLPNGKVLIAGGTNGVYLASAELYDPTAGTFSVTGSLATARALHTATLLPNGKVLIAGGYNSVHLASAELYDPAAGTFSVPASLATARAQHTATLLPNGKVLIAGGYGGSGNLLTVAELYDPAAGTFSVTASLATARYFHTATLLPNGKVLIAGGYGLSGNLSTAELYDPAAGTFSVTGSLATARYLHMATLLPNGKVLIGGGYNGAFIATAELYDIGLGFAESQRPLVSSWPFSGQTEPATMALSGSGFRGISETSSGNSSPTNYPILQLQRIDNEQIFVIGASANWSDISFTSTTLSGLPNGYYRVTIVTNAIPSIQRLVLIAYAQPSITNVTPSSGPTNGGQSVTITGTALDNLWNVTFGGTLGTVTAGSASSITVTTPASNAGIVVLAVNTAGGTASGSYTFVFGAPTSLNATATSTTSVSVMWPAVYSATSYDVARSSDGINYTIITSTNGTLATDYAVAPNTSYLYKVRAVSGSATAYTAPDLATTVIFTDATLSGVFIKAVHITELRTAVNAVHVLAGLGAATFTDPTITPGVTLVKAAHITELRSNLDSSRSTLGLPAQSYTGSTITASSTIIKAQHILDLRSGVQ